MNQISPRNRNLPGNAQDYPINAGTVSQLRKAVADYASSLGMTTDDRERIVIASNELVTNVLRHGGGTGHLYLWHDSANLYCEVSDTGAGFADPAEFEGGARAQPNSLAGRGLWMIRNLIPQMSLHSDDHGTSVTLALPRA